MALVRAGSYASAADELYLSPTTIHGQIRALEKELGTTLVTFNDRKLTLTAAGVRVLLFAERTVRERSRLDAEIRGLSLKSPTRLRIASLFGPSIHLLPPAVTAFRRLRPEVVISITTRDVGSGLANLNAGQADIVILNEAHAGELTDDFLATPLYEDDLAMIIRADQHRTPDVELLERYPIAAQGATSSYRRYIERWARAAGVSFHVAFEHSSFEGLLSYVLQGDCIGMVGGYVTRMSLLTDRFRVLDLPDFHYKREILAAYPIRPNPLAVEFVNFFRDYCMELQDRPHPSFELFVEATPD